MKSKAHFKSHPIHPMLVGFPITFFFAAFAFDLLSIIRQDDQFWLIGEYLSMAGVISGFIAAIPGSLDYFYTLPKNSSAKKRGTKHALLNITAISGFIIALILRGQGIAGNSIVTLIELFGIVLLCIAGWHGGTLVYRNQIGVDVRYAGAGKWNETFFRSGEKNIDAASTNELKNNQMKLIHVGDKRIVLCNSEGRLAAFDDHCTHRGGALSGGSLICGTVQCPWHGSQFDIHTGEAKEGPAKEKIKTYIVHVKGDRIYIEIP